MLYDIGCTSNHNDIWTITANRDKLERKSDYSILSELNIGTSAMLISNNISSTDYHLEIDVFIEDGSNNEILQVLNSSYQYILGKNGIVGEWSHISFDVTNVSVNSIIRLLTPGTITSLRFKNFIITNL